MQPPNNINRNHNPYVFFIVSVFSVFVAIVALRMATKPSNSNLNGARMRLGEQASSAMIKGTKNNSLTLTYYAVFKKPLGLFSQKPMTGFFRDGYCRTGPDDAGNHAVAGTFSLLSIDSPNSFRSFSTSLSISGNHKNKGSINLTSSFLSQPS